MRRIAVRDLAASGGDGTWQTASFELADGWRSTAAFYGRPHQPVQANIQGDELAAVGRRGRAAGPLERR